jgi:hypothetical protein
MQLRAALLGMRLTPVLLEVKIHGDAGFRIGRPREADLARLPGLMGTLGTRDQHCSLLMERLSSNYQWRTGPTST